MVDSEDLQKNSDTTKLPVPKGLRIDMASLRQELRRGELVMALVSSRANLSDPMTKSNQSSSEKLMRPDGDMKKPLLIGFRTNCKHLKRVRQIKKTQADMSYY